MSGFEEGWHDDLFWSYYKSGTCKVTYEHCGVVMDISRYIENKQQSSEQIEQWAGISLIYSLIRPYYTITLYNMLVSKTREKTREKRERNKNASDYALGKNASQLRFSRVLLAFLFTNANQKHSVKWALVFIL